MTITIRPASLADVPVLDSIEQECFSDPTWKGNDFLQQTCFVAELDKQLVAFLVLRTTFDGDPAECEILNLAVVPVARRLGVASMLMNHAFRPNTRCFLEVRESNVPARNLYKKLGFSEIGQRPNYYTNPAETAIVMTRE